MRAYEEPPFVEPLGSTFVYVAWRVDPVRVGPFVRRSDIRRAKIDEIRTLAGVLTHRREIEGVRLFETSFMPPLPNMPNYDVVMLARAGSTEAAAQIGTITVEGNRSDDGIPGLQCACFGVTENGMARANILLNHFVGPPDRSAAMTAWRAISGWFTTKMGVDNSTLLCTEDPAPFVLVNYVRLSRGPVVGFLLNQLLRPSFHRYVRALLKRYQSTPLPLFVRVVLIGSAGA